MCTKGDNNAPRPLMARLGRAALCARRRPGGRSIVLCLAALMSERIVLCCYIKIILYYVSNKKAKDTLKDNQVKRRSVANAETYDGKLATRLRATGYGLRLRATAAAAGEQQARDRRLLVYLADS
ncbi:hypothetical protein EVAR_95128_1 [Eumeta japonica]|uniref:Uncharacterized protein n=1 Tax=Eumeta variegata TaxID=151549 RepID=A0A4C1W518_EUMVA|nr:hypothetical protein EVAR_95128_1 [Eumeta japonica]